MSNTSSSGTTSNSVYSGHLTSKIRHEYPAPSRLRDREASPIPATTRRLLPPSTLLQRQAQERLAMFAFLQQSANNARATSSSCGALRHEIQKPAQGVPYVRSEWRQIKVSSRAKTEHRAQETFPRIAGSRDKEIEGNRCSSFREANCGKGMNTRVPFSAKAGAQALRDLPLPRDPEGRNRNAARRQSPWMTYSERKCNEESLRR